MMPSLRFLILTSIILATSFSARGQLRLWGDSTGVPVITAAGAQRNAHSVPDGNGGVWIAFESASGSIKELLLQRLDRFGQHMHDSTGIAIASSQSAMTLIDAVVSEDGVIAVWLERKDGDINQRVYLQRIGRNGGLLWAGSGVAAFPEHVKTGPVQCIPDSNGGIIICAEDRTDAANSNIIAQRIDADGNPAWSPGGVIVSSSAANERIPRLTADRSGGCFIAWVDERNNGDIIAQHVGKTGNLLWHAGGINITNHQAEQTNPRILAFGENECLIIWEDSRTRDTSNIYIGIVGSTGAIHLIDTLCDAPGAQWLSDAGEDGSGGAIVAWVDFRSNAEGDIYARRITKEGIVTWGVRNQGLAVCTAANVQEQPHIIGDGFGGAFIAWQDKRNGADFNLWMQSLDSNGIRRWNSNGRMLVGEAMNQFGLHLAPSEPGSATAVWTDGRIADGISDIYAQKIGYTPVLALADSLTFDPVYYGDEKTVEFPLQNMGPGPMVITSLFVSGSQSTDFVFAEQLPMPLTLSENEKIPVKITFRPRSSGYRMSRLFVRGQMDGNNYLHPPYALPLSGFCYRPDFDVFPRRIEFAVQKVGTSQDSVLPYCLHNTGTGPLTVESIFIDGPSATSFTLVSPTAFPYQIPSGDSSGIRIRFTSSMNNLQYAMLTVITNGINASRAIFLRGSGGEYPVAIAFPQVLAFDTSAGETVQRTFLVKTTGSLPLLIHSAAVEGRHSSDFELLTALPKVIQTKDSLFLTVSFSPGANGERFAYLRLRTDMLQPDILIGLQGTGKDISGTLVTESPALRQLHAEFFPNPLTPSSVVSVSLPQAVEATVAVYSSLGNRVQTLYAGILYPGEHRFRFDSERLQTGTYFCIVEAGNSRTIARALVIR